MRNFTPLIILTILLTTCLYVMVPMPAFMSEKPKVSIEHVSASKMSDGSLTVYCMFVNRDTVSVTDVHIEVYTLDSMDNILDAKELVFFSSDSLRSNQKAIFTENFSDCWPCEGVKVVPK
jgi:hypothetical protein